MQFIESSLFGVRSAVITLKRRTTPLRFVLIPMVHVAEQSFYDAVLARLADCALIVAEGAPSRYAPMQRRMSQLRWDDLVDQMVGLDLESAGVPVQWEHAVDDDRQRTRAEQVSDRVLDSAAAVAFRVLGRYGDPRKSGGLDESDARDDSWDRWAEGGRLGRTIEEQVLMNRDAALVKALGTIHRTRYTEPISVGVVWGAAHMPAVVDYLGGDFRYFVDHAEWLTVAHARE